MLKWLMKSGVAFTIYSVGKAAPLVLINAPLRSNEHDALRLAFLTQRLLGFIIRLNTK
jgi:hypothetical protein